MNEVLKIKNIFILLFFIHTFILLEKAKKQGVTG
jgi:hypothetical protein